MQDNVDQILNKAFTNALEANSHQSSKISLVDDVLAEIHRKQNRRSRTMFATTVIMMCCIIFMINSFAMPQILQLVESLQAFGSMTISPALIITTMTMVISPWLMVILDDRV